MDNLSDSPKYWKRVAIITHFHDSINYGGVLQAYALRKVIDSMGYKCEQLRYQKSRGHSEPLVLKIKDLFINHLKNAISANNLIGFTISAIKYSVAIIPRKIIQLIVYHRESFESRHENFSQFNKIHIPSSDVYTKDTIHNASSKYDIFITGSDQVWNPNWFYEEYYLAFVPDNKPKIAYAASTAVSFITQDQKKLMKPLISRFQSISVREENAPSLLMDMTDKKIEWVIDPTLLLTAKEWNQIATENPVKEPYVFSYILGDNWKNPRAAASFAKQKNLKMVTFPYVASMSSWQAFFGDIHCYGGPNEWLSLISDAEYVITDSYHAVIFSIIYQKKFIFLRRNADDEIGSMNSRMYSLCKMFPEIEKRIVDPEMITNHINEDIDWNSLLMKLTKKRDDSWKWLSNSLARN